MSGSLSLVPSFRSFSSVSLGFFQLQCVKFGYFLYFMLDFLIILYFTLSYLFVSLKETERELIHLERKMGGNLEE